MSRTAVENEASIQSFRRERVAEGVQVAHVTLRRGETSLLHSHTNTRDTFYIAAGCLTLTLYEHAGTPTPSFQPISARPAEVREQRAGQVLRFRLHPGDVFVIEPNVVHCAANLDDEACSFLCIEGIGTYDFVLAEGS
ncbi:MAG TPA: cupin domain-containing protein [Polyangiaceae bacterium]|nr:cupin domain-containing protein [Polyangiaceae bacterium]